MDKALVIFALLLGGTLLTLARRTNNHDPDAGYGVAGWTIFLIFIYLLYT